MVFKLIVIVCFIRVTPGNPGILVAINPTENATIIDIPKEIPQLSDLEEVTVQFCSKSYSETVAEKYVNNFSSFLFFFLIAL